MFQGQPALSPACIKVQQNSQCCHQQGGHISLGVPLQIVAFVTPQAKAAAGSDWELPQAQHNKQIVWLTTGKLGKAKLRFSCAVISVPWGM